MLMYDRGRNDMSENKHVLAMYDVRGKQEFIFRTKRLQEIVGGSWIIRDIYDDYLYDAAKSAGGGIYHYKNCNDDRERDFSPESFEKHLANGYLGEVVYEGGGNFLLLFKDKSAFQKVTYEFTKLITERIGTLRVLGTCMEIDDFSDFPKDRRELYKNHRRNEAQESNISPWSCLPIVQVDRKTSQPLVEYDFAGDKHAKEVDEKAWESIKNDIRRKGVEDKLTKESTAKLIKFYTEKKKLEKADYHKLSDVEKDFYKNNESELDRLVTEKGVESQLAVVYIDGNNMGAKVQSKTDGKTTYGDCVKALRDFSEETQKIYVEEGIRSALGDLRGEKNKHIYRIVVSAGDEINFIVNAHDAFRCAGNYLNYLSKIDGASACAGIAVFHSHAPYADAYRIAEEACESGKQKMKAARMDCASFIDFHICQGAIGTSLEEIRMEENGDTISRPWMLWANNESEKKDEQITDYESDVKPVRAFLKVFARTNVKGLLASAKEGIVPLQMELNRMYGHASMENQEKYKTEWNDLQGKFQSSYSEKLRGIIYDLALCYDLWFAGEEGK